MDWMAVPVPYSGHHATKTKRKKKTHFQANQNARGFDSHNGKRRKTPFQSHFRATNRVIVTVKKNARWTTKKSANYP